MESEPNKTERIFFMTTIPAELMKEYVNSQQFKSTTEIMEAMKEMFRDVLQQVMESELDTELGYEKSVRTSDSAVENDCRNYRNGYSQKTVKTQLGEVDIKVPRDRNGSYEPQIIGKYDRSADGMEEKIISLYACGMSQRDISEQIKGLYDVEISPELVSKISEKIMPEVTAWQNRPLEKVYPFVFLDAIHYKVKENHQYITKAAYVVLGITMDGNKDILGLWIGENESSKFWLSVLNDLKSRGIMEIYLFCVDGLKGFVEAIGAVYPQAHVQRCIIHQIRSSTRYVSYKDIKALMADLKLVYKAVTEDEAMRNLIVFKEKWGRQYPSCVKSWEENWDILSTFFAYPTEVRKIIYTTNIIEGLNRQFRQITKSKPSFTSDDSLRKMLYLASKKIVEHWTARCRNWDVVLSQLNLMFAEREDA
jgi:putative transposase